MFSTRTLHAIIAGTPCEIDTYKSYPLLNISLLRLLDFYII